MRENAQALLNAVRQESVVLIEDGNEFARGGRDADVDRQGGAAAVLGRRINRTAAGADCAIRSTNAAVPSFEQSSTTITSAGRSVWAKTEASASSMYAEPLEAGMITETAWGMDVTCSRG